MLHVDLVDELLDLEPLVFGGAVAPGIGKGESEHRGLDRDPHPALPLDVFGRAEEVILGLVAWDAAVEHQVDVALARVVGLEKGGIDAQVLQQRGVEHGEVVAVADLGLYAFALE